MSSFVGDGDIRLANPVTEYQTGEFYSRAIDKDLAKIKDVSKVSNEVKDNFTSIANTLRTISNAFVDNDRRFNVIESNVKILHRAISDQNRIAIDNESRLKNIEKGLQRITTQTAEDKFESALEKRLKQYEQKTETKQKKMADNASGYKIGQFLGGAAAIAYLAKQLWDNGLGDYVTDKVDSIINGQRAADMSSKELEKFEKELRAWKRGEQRIAPWGYRPEEDKKTILGMGTGPLTRARVGRAEDVKQTINKDNDTYYPGGFISSDPRKQGQSSLDKAESASNKAKQLPKAVSEAIDEKVKEASKTWLDWFVNNKNIQAQRPPAGATQRKEKKFAPPMYLGGPKEAGLPPGSKPLKDDRSLYEKIVNWFTETFQDEPIVNPGQLALKFAEQADTDGLHEVKDREQLKKFFGFDPAAEPWCAKYVEHFLEKAGVSGAGSVASNYRNIGVPGKGERGDIMIRKRTLKSEKDGQREYGRKVPTGKAGSHVGIYTGKKMKGPDGKTYLQYRAGNEVMGDQGEHRSSGYGWIPEDEATARTIPAPPNWKGRMNLGMSDQVSKDEAFFVDTSRVVNIKGITDINMESGREITIKSNSMIIFDSPYIEFKNLKRVFYGETGQGDVEPTNPSNEMGALGTKGAGMSQLGGPTGAIGGTEGAQFGVRSLPLSKQFGFGGIGNVLGAAGPGMTSLGGPGGGYSGGGGGGGGYSGGGSDLNPDAVIAAAAQGVKPPDQLIDDALKLRGLHEVRNRQAIKEYLRSGGYNVDPADTAWCAAFVGSTLAKHGITPDKTLVARQYNNWGDAVKAAEAKAGDVMVMKGVGVGGHIGFYTGRSRTNNGRTEYEMVGGNQVGPGDTPKNPGTVTTQWRTAGPGGTYNFRRAKPEYYKDGVIPGAGDYPAPGTSMSQFPGAVKSTGGPDRSRFAEELKDPKVRRLFQTMMGAEVGSMGPEAQTGFAETVFNRAAIEGKSLREILSNRKYYQPYKDGGFARSARSMTDEKAQRFDQIIDAVYGGSNITGGATHNASGSVARTAVSRYDAVAGSMKNLGGETFYSKTYEQKRVRQLLASVTKQDIAQALAKPQAISKPQGVSSSAAEMTKQAAAVSGVGTRGGGAGVKSAAMVGEDVEVMAARRAKANSDRWHRENRQTVGAQGGIVSRPEPAPSGRPKENAAPNTGGEDNAALGEGETSGENVSSPSMAVPTDSSGDSMPPQPGSSGTGDYSYCLI